MKRLLIYKGTLNESLESLLCISLADLVLELDPNLDYYHSVLSVQRVYLAISIDFWLGGNYDLLVRVFEIRY